MKNTEEQKLTTVKININLFQEFKYQCIKNKFSFQKLASRAIFLYLTKEDFRKEIHKLNNINLEKIDGK
jgi:hypothetical protein